MSIETKDPKEIYSTLQSVVHLMWMCAEHDELENSMAADTTQLISELLNALAVACGLTEAGCAV